MLGKRALCVIAVWASLIAGALAADTSMFNYQARVLVDGIPYTGAGQVKAAILASSGDTTATVWSNDGSSVAGSEPVTAFAVNVSGGLFDVQIGDTEAGMDPIRAIVFNRDDILKVRVWFNDGQHGFQALSPDRRLISPRRLGINEIHTTTTLYVNAATGNDLNSGLTPADAKKSIQAAVDMVPGRVCRNLTIDVAPGIYRETVCLTGITVQYPYNMIISGDKTTVPSDTVSPTVRLTGCDNDATHVKVRDHGMDFNTCYNITVQGILFDYFNCAVYPNQAVVAVTRCKTNNNGQGIYSVNSTTNCTSCWAMNSTYNAFSGGGGYLYLTNCGATDSQFGCAINGFCSAAFFGTNQIRRNTYGIFISQAFVWFESSSIEYVSNCTTGLTLQYNGCTRLISRVQYSSNTTNSIIGTDSNAL